MVSPSGDQGYENAKEALKRPEIVVAMQSLATTQAQSQLPQHSVSSRNQTFDDGKAAYNRGRYTDAINIFRLLAAEEHADAQNNLGVMYVMGQGVARDDQEALKWFRLSAAQGTESAKASLKRPEMIAAAKNATMQAQPQHSVSSRTQTSDDAKTAILKGNYAQAINIFRMLASQGDAVAQTDLGWMYSRGKGVTQNDREAVKWFRLAAEQGYAAAQNDLGTMYGMGFGVTEDDLEAVKWYRLSAAQGYAAAQSNLGTMFDNGEGVTQDYQEALKWYRLSAAQGHAAAQSNLGTMYKEGKGVIRNYQEALKWYRLAAAQGFEFAQESLKRPEMVEAAKNSKRR